MNKLIINKITISNFKGFTTPITFTLRDKTNNKYNNITGKNGIGKSSIIDAIYYTLTTKLFKGNNQGWEHLTENNQPSGLYPHIILDISINNIDCLIELKNSKRSLNGIVFNSYKDFEKQLNSMGIDTENLLLISNPEYLLNNLDTKEQRELFLNLYPIENIVDEVEKLKLDFKYINLTSFKLIPNISLHIKNLKSKINKVKIELDTINKQQEMLNKNISITDEDKQILEQYNSYNSQHTLTFKDWNKFQANNLLSSKCDKCNRDFDNINKKDKELIEHNLKILNSYQKKMDECAKMMKQLQPQVDLIRNKEREIQLIEKINSDIDSTKNLKLIELNNLTMEEMDFILFQDTRINIIENLFKKDLDFDIKLFQQTKTGGQQETFSILSNGVDYKFLNTAKKIEMGIKLCEFLQTKKFNTNYPIFVDNAESISSSNIKKLEEKNNKNIVFSMVTDGDFNDKN